MLIYKSYKTENGANKFLLRLKKKYEFAEIIDTPKNVDNVYVFETNKRK